MVAKSYRLTICQKWQVKIKSYEDLKNDIDYKTIC